MEGTNGVMPVYNLSDMNRGGFSSDWMWIFVFFILFGWGGNGFGYGNNAAANTVTGEYLLNQTSKLSEQILTQANANALAVDSISHDVMTNINTLGYNTQQGFNDVRYAALENTCGINRNIDNLRYDMADKFCKVYNRQEADKAEILQAIHNTSCEERIAALEKENLELSQAAQTATILSALRGTTSI